MWSYECIQFRCAKIPTSNVRSLNVLIERSAIESKRKLHIKIPTDIDTFLRNLSRPTMTQYTRQQVWRLRKWPMLTSSPYGVRWSPRGSALDLRRSFHVEQNVRISKVKRNFAKAAEHNFSTIIFRIGKVIDRRTRAFYELENINGTPIDGQF